MSCVNLLIRAVVRTCKSEPTLPSDDRSSSVVPVGLGGKGIALLKPTVNKVLSLRDMKTMRSLFHHLSSEGGKSCEPQIPLDFDKRRSFCFHPTFRVSALKIHLKNRVALLGWLAKGERHNSPGQRPGNSDVNNCAG
jgi:hypothetical protein